MANSLSDRFAKFVSDVKSDKRAALYLKRLRSAGWDSMLEHGLAAVAEVKEAVAKPSPYSVLRAGMAVARVVQPGKLYAHEVFQDQSEWKLAFPPSIGRQLVDVLEAHVTDRFSLGAEDGCQLHIVDKNGVVLAWIGDDDDEGSVVVYTSPSCYPASVAFGRKLLWESVDPTRVVITTRRGSLDGPERNGSHGCVRAVTDDMVDVVASSRAMKYAEHYRRCVEKKIRRTVLFYGPPGSGKSCMVRTIASELKMRSLRFRVEDIGAMGSDVIEEMLKIFEPDVVILDDLDRSYSQVSMFETLELLHKSVKLVFATVNHPEKLDEALRRPGRFDEIEKIDKLEEHAVRSILGQNNQDAYAKVKSWPVTFIREYLVRVELHGHEEAAKSLRELEKRVSELRKGKSRVEDPDAEEDC